MEFVKRHWWLVATLAAMVVLAGSAIALWVVFNRQMGQREAVLKKSRDFLRPSTAYYNEKAAGVLEGATAYRQKQLDEMMSFVKQPNEWQPLIPGIFPRYQADTQVLNFRLAYQAKLRQFMKELGAVNAAESPLGIREATMFSSEKAFHKATWIDDPLVSSSPDVVMQHLCESQNDLWLMEEIVRIIKDTNNDYFRDTKIESENRKVAKAVIKELLKLEIGAQVLELAATAMGRDHRYLTVSGGTTPYGGAGLAATAEEPEVDVRAKTLTGRASNNNGGVYKVLPFRVTVIADAGNYLELVRRLSGTRSFLTVDKVRYEVVCETENMYRQAGLTCPNLNVSDRVEIYGLRPLANVVITGESLVFQVPGARPTVLPKKPAVASGAGA